MYAQRNEYNVLSIFGENKLEEKFLQYLCRESHLTSIRYKPVTYSTEYSTELIIGGEYSFFHWAQKELNIKNSIELIALTPFQLKILISSKA